MLWEALFFAAFLRQIVAQTTNATCDVSHKWANNKQGDNPCQVASSLVAVCSGSYQVSALPDGFHYNGPDVQDANGCWCNTVTYSLFSECALCQEESFISWDVWEINCVNVTRNAFPEPLPAGLQVQGWAYLPLDNSDNFNETQAFANANLTGSSAPSVSQPSKTPTASAASVSSHSTSASATASAPATTPASDASSAAASKQKRANAVGGGIIGALAAVALFGGLAFYLHRRRHIAQTQGAILRSPSMTEQHAGDAAPPSTTHPVPSITISSLHSQPSTNSASELSAV
ncbi:hypothetical protein HMN09_00094600 [Mycena chlorophos]|uniref:Uncharacterized protein n=1 Tax=Mycena chlorophos TaxID=658473 RepID=A0A8H6TQ68_MYCCL|nr:hypothetical protein HMN09_00094600 [Mycena chlorophos]